MIEREQRIYDTQDPTVWNLYNGLTEYITYGMDGHNTDRESHTFRNTFYSQDRRQKKVKTFLKKLAHETGGYQAFNILEH